MHVASTRRFRFFDLGAENMWGSTPLETLVASVRFDFTGYLVNCMDMDAALVSEGITRSV
jgi:hypothetical protein